MTVLARYESPLGPITLAGSGSALTGLWFDGQKHFGSTIGDSALPGDLPVLDEARRWLDIYFAGSIPDFTPNLSISGTPFQRKIWSQLLSIPYGETAFYGGIAHAAGTGSARAVGTAVGRNPISLIVPCHRVVGRDGALTGYAGGTNRKRLLLLLEQGAITPAELAEEYRKGLPDA